MILIKFLFAGTLIIYKSKVKNINMLFGYIVYKIVYAIIRSDLILNVFP